jgi:hypothetical protein
MLPRLVIAVAACLLAAAPASARIQLPDPLPPVPRNPANALAGTPIEAVRYDHATRCMPGKRRRGVELFTQWLTDHSRGVSWGSYRCEKWGKHKASLHAEGRALDWHLDASRRADAAEAERLILLLLAPDKTGEPQALARRMGLEEIIWDCGYLGIGSTEFSKLDACFDRRGRRRKRIDPTQAHRDHIHFGFTRRGAGGRTSFWAR